MENDVRARSWFCVLNNPADHGFSGAPDEIAEQMKERWIVDNPQRTCAVAFCVSAEGLPHCHAVFEDTQTMRFTAVQKLFPGMHIEVTKGNKEQAENYINKRGKWQEKGENILCIVRHGDIKGFQGQRRDHEIIYDLVEQGLTPNQIMAISFSYRRYEKMIKQAYFDKRKKETPILRDVKVFWHVGESGSGKTYTYVKLCEEYGEENVYFLNDYDKGGFDEYVGERVLCMDEFRGQMRFALLMNYLDGYRVQIPCRYTNGYALWDEVHIFTIMPPEMVYRAMVEENRCVDTYDQLKRRITAVVYHYRENGVYKTFELPMEKYTNYDDLCRLAEMPPEQQHIPEWCEGKVEEMEIYL